VDDHDPGRRIDDLFNLVCDPAVPVVAWVRVWGYRGKLEVTRFDGHPRSGGFGPDHGQEEAAASLFCFRWRWQDQPADRDRCNDPVVKPVVKLVVRPRRSASMRVTGATQTMAPPPR